MEEDKDVCARFDAKCPHPINEEKKVCFIMMAYDKPYSKKIEIILKKSVKVAFKLEPKLSKNIKQTGSGDMYCKTVCRPIRESTLCIADLTYNNTNIGFEFGVAQELKKPVIITVYKPKKQIKLGKKAFEELKKLEKKGAIQFSEVPQKIPSDMGGMLRVEYSSEEELIKKLKEQFEVKLK